MEPWLSNFFYEIRFFTLILAYLLSTPSVLDEVMGVPSASGSELCEQAVKLESLCEIHNTYFREIDVGIPVVT